jgi:hypothetical protein
MERSDSSRGVTVVGEQSVVVRSPARAAMGWEKRIVVFLEDIRKTVPDEI